MRAHGRVVDVPQPGTTDHVCWVYDDPRDLESAAGRFLAGGLARGERLLVVGDGMTGALHRETLPFGGTDALVDTGALEILDLTTAYEYAGQFTPEQQLGFYRAATRRAQADGFTGLRVAAEVSALAADPDTRAELVRWEHLADSYVAQGSGFTAMCAYRGDLGGAALEDVAAVHPVLRGPQGLPAFQVFSDEDRVVLTGSVDVYSADRLHRVLVDSPGARGGGILDLGRLDFVDVAGCRVLARWAAGLEGPLQVGGSSRLVQRMWRLLDLDRMAPVTFLGAPA
ncbi:MAG: MEDS domain-containing protein [Actinomycetes bacterium]